MSKSLRIKQLYHDRDWLYDRYVTKRMSTCEIAREFREGSGIWLDPNTVSRWLKKHDIPIRPASDAQKNRYGGAK